MARYQDLQSSYTRLYREHEEVTRVLAEVQSLPQTRPPNVERTKQLAAESSTVPRDAKTVTRTPTRVDNLSGVIDAVRQMVTDWGGVVDTVEALAREVEERRVAHGGLERAHEALLATHEQLRQEFEASVQMTAGLEATHEELLRERAGARNPCRTGDAREVRDASSRPAARHRRAGGHPPPVQGSVGPGRARGWGGARRGGSRTVNAHRLTGDASR